MDDSGSSQEETSPGRAAPSIAFAQAMAGVAARRSQISISLNSQEFAQIEHDFRSAANLWLAGRSACRRLMANGLEATPDAKAAMDLLNENYRALLELLARTYKAIEELSVRKSLDDVRMSIVKAMAQPLHETTETATDAKDRR